VRCGKGQLSKTLGRNRRIAQRMFTFVETPLFMRLLSDYRSNDEYRELQSALSAAPESGAVIPGSGGVRKLRWSMSGRGKRGGLRVIYFVSG
jgi:hypothetical protein